MAIKLLTLNHLFFSNTRIAEGLSKEETADKLAVTAVIVNDLKEKRLRDYKFSWKHALHSTGNSGIKLQVRKKSESLMNVNRRNFNTFRWIILSFF